MSDTCETLYDMIPGIIFPILFIASEMMPLASKIKSNGLLHLIFLTIERYYVERRLNDESEPLLEEV